MGKAEPREGEPQVPDICWSFHAAGPKKLNKQIGSNCLDQLQLVNKRLDRYKNLFVLISATLYLNNSVSVSGLNGSPELQTVRLSPGVHEHVQN